MSTIPAPTLFAQRYHITAHLGDSRIASVHRADDARLQRSVLLHIQHSPTSPPLQNGGVRGLLRVYDSGMLTDGRAYMITEDVSGHALADIAPLTPLQTITVVRAVTTTVIEAQAQRAALPLITRGNVWVFDHDRVVLLDDWHLAATQRAQLEAAYQAPAVNPGTATPPSSVFALGVLLREALTGSPSPNQAAHVPLQLARIIERATAPNTQQRLATPDAFAQALDQYTANIDTPTAYMPPAQAATVPMQPVAAHPQLVPVAPPRPTTVMAGPPPSLHVPPPAPPTPPAASSAAQRVRGWQMPRWNVGSWQRAVIRRGWWLVQRVVLIVLILIGLKLGYTAISDRARGINAGQWVAANTPQFDLGRWIGEHTPNLQLPDANVGAWAQQQINSLRDNGSRAFHNAGTPATVYRVRQQINLRSAPSAADANTIIAALPAGTRVQQIGTPQADTNGNSYKWIRVAVLDGTQAQAGWVALLNDRLEQE